jgi:predicted PP-loop superfamily ATPase
MNAEEHTAILLDDIEQETALLQDRLTRISEMMVGTRAELEKGVRDVAGHPCGGRTLRALVLMNKSALKVCEDTGADCLCSDLEDVQPLN